MLKIFPDNPKRRQLGICISILAAAVLASLSIFATGPSAVPRGPVEKAWPVSVTHAEKQRIKPNFSAYGKIESSQVAQLRSQWVALIRSVQVKEGDWVEAGEVLVQLDHRQAGLDLRQAEAELQQQQANLHAAEAQLKWAKENTRHFLARRNVAQQRLARHQDLLDKRLIAKSLFDDVRSQADQTTIEYHSHLTELGNLPNRILGHQAQIAKAQARVQQAGMDLEKTTVTAPFAGPVLGVFVAPGDLSNLSAPLVQMANADAFELRVQVPDVYQPQFEHALSIAAEEPITANTEQGHQLRLSRLAAHVRRGQTGMDAFFTPTNHNPLTLGRTLKIFVQMPAQSDLIALPVQSIYNNSRIYTVRDNRLVAHEIERVGERQTRERGYEVLVRSNALGVGDMVITTQLPRAINGLLVKVANPPGRMEG